ncbi:agmatine deiminase [Mycobacteroides abscessus]|nr:agmatine deiminase [Mycobacteroides abscessus]CPZ24444.1 agmatine deiminase [Mycobacteroides abscessus]
MHRRHLFKLGAATAGAVMLTACADPPDGDVDTDVVNDSTSWRMPDEGEPHLRTWMAFGASAEIWGKRLNRKVQQNLGAIARAIAQFEPVSMLVRPEEAELARQLAGPGIELVPVALNDLWIRDSGPVYVHNESGRAAVDFNFNGWGDKQEHKSDAMVADEVAKQAGVPTIHTELVLEAGPSKSTAGAPQSSPKAACSTTIATEAAPRARWKPSCGACSVCTRSSGCPA